MADIPSLVAKLSKTEHGFKHIVDAGEKLLENTEFNHLDLAVKLINNEIFQARMLGTFLLGVLSAEDKSALETLKTRVAKDENWRVQEMLAKAFDQYAKTVGYEKSLSVLNDWLEDKNPNVVRAVIEGLRIWTSRPYFKQNPEVAIKLISKHKADESEYVRKSAGNALRDISRKHEDLIENETSAWDLSDKKIAFTFKLVVKNG